MTTSAPAADLSHVKKTLWALLCFCTFASITANVAHAVLANSAVDYGWVGPVLIALLAPTILLWLMHLVGVWSRDIRSRGPVFWVILGTVVGLGAVAFRLSFSQVRDLAQHYGLARFDASLVPLMLDGVIVTCTLALVALSWLGGAAAEPDAAPQSDAETDPAPVRVTTAVRAPAASMTRPRHDAVTRRDPHEILIAPPAYSVASRIGGAPVPDAVTRPESAPVAHPRQGDAPEGGAAMTQPVTREDAVARQSDPAVTRDGDALDDPGDPLDVAQLDTPEMTRPDPASDGAVARTGDPDCGAVDPAGDDAVTQPMARIGDPDHDAPAEVGDADSDEGVARSDDAPVARRLAAVPTPPKLSKQDAEILERTIAGESAQTIADAVGVSKSTALRKIRRVRSEAGLPPVEASA